MKGNTDIRTELELISKPVAAIPDKPVFTVPDGYFDRFPELMLLKVKALDEELTADQETAAISPLLAGLGKKMPMQVPEGYFEKIAQPERPVASAPVVSMQKKSFRVYAVAASVIAVLGFAMLLYRMSVTEQPPMVSVSVKEELPKLSEQEMGDFLAAFPDLTAGTDPVNIVAGNMEVEEMITDVDEKGLEEFLSELPDLQSSKLN